MAVLLVRHAVALARRKWEGPDDLRPLSGRGRRQANKLVELLAPYEIDRVLSSPSLRCTQTIAPLAEARSVSVETDEDLAEGHEQGAAAVLRSVAGERVVLCSHGDVIPVVLQHLPGVDLGRQPRWAKGSTWALEAEDGRFVRATYLPPTQ